MNLTITQTTSPKKIPETITSFGEIFTDHMFIMDYEEGSGWKNHRIVPYEKLSLDPATAVLHYGQGIFEGLKAYKDTEGIIRLFRPEMNLKRFNRSAKRLAMPEVDEDDVLEALETLVMLDKDWIPTDFGSSLYIRPFMIATDVTLNVHNSRYFSFMIILSPSSAYLKSGFNPVKIEVSTGYVRAVRGGVGEAKTMGNYAAAILASTQAEAKGDSQVLRLDGVEGQYIEEVGSMNIMFKVGNKVLTPMLNGSILPGITRDSIITYLKSIDVEVEERRISIDELVEAANQGELKEIFGVGTAAVVSPISELIYGDEVLKASAPYDENSLSSKIYDNLTGIQYGKREDSFGWVRILNERN